MEQEYGTFLEIFCMHNIMEKINLSQSVLKALKSFRKIKHSLPDLNMAKYVPGHLIF